MQGRVARFLVPRCGFAAVLLAIVTLVSLFGSAHWFADLLTHFRLHYLAAALAVGAALAWWRRPRLALVAFAAAALNAVDAADCLPGPAAGPAGPALTVLQFNVNSAHPDPGRVLRWLDSKRGEVDVFVLLEVGPAWRATLESLAASHPEIVSIPRSDNFGIAVASRVPGSRAAATTIGSIGLPSIELSGRLGGSGDEFALIATHPGPPLGAALSAARDEQLEAVARSIADSPAEHRIVAGDLNATPWSAAMAPLYGAGLREAPGPSGCAGTWPSLIAWAGIPIDRALASPGLAVVGRVVGPDLGSDHRPVITRYALSAP